MRPILNPKFEITFTNINGKGLLVDLNKNQFININETGVIIWETLSENNDYEVALDIMLNKIDTDYENMNKHVRQFIEKLKNLKLIEDINI